MLIGFCGLSHLGLVTMTSFAEKGFETIGFDFSNKLISKLKKGIIEINEENLSEIFKKNESRISLTEDISELSKCDVIYISEDVSTNEMGESDLARNTVMIESVLKIIKESQILVILNQVPPGFTRSFQTKHRKTYYQVETLIFGKAMKRALYPERIIIGKENDAEILSPFDSVLRAFNCPIIEMSFESAEFSKIAINTYLTATVSLTNALAESAMELNVDWWKVKEALILDKRIGEFAYLNPGLGISGGNLERDLQTIIDISNKSSLINDLVNVFINVSNKQKHWLENRINEYIFGTNFSIGLLGITYKPGTNSIKNSVGFRVLEKFNDSVVCLYDPTIKVNSDQFFSKEVASIQKCVDSCDILVVATAWDEFKNIEKYVNNSKIQIIIDPFDVINPINLIKKISYVSLTRKIIVNEH